VNDHDDWPVALLVLLLIPVLLMVLLGALVSLWNT
jgi:hypothetical protein